MRRLIIVVSILLVAGGAAAAGWRLLRPRDALAEARGYLAKGQPRAAELVLRAAVQADPGRAEPHFRLGELQLRLGDPIAAERELRAAREHGFDPEAVRPPLARAIVAQGRDAEVLRDYAPDGLAPDAAATVLIARAQAQFDLHQPAQAEAAVTDAIRLAPRSVDARLAAARLALAGDDRTGAAERVEEALAIDPHQLAALLLQAGLRAEAGDRTQALASYAAALGQVGVQAGGQAGDQAQAAAQTIRLSRAALLAAMEQDAAARADIDAVLQAQPKQPVANFLSARLLARAGDWRAADAALMNVGPVLSKLPNGDLVLAQVKLNLGEPQQAVEAAERQVERTPDNLAARKFLARLQLAQHRPDLAVTALSTAAGALDAEALELLGDAYTAGTDLAHAAQALRQARALLPDDARLLIHLAALEMGLGEPRQAADALEHALDAERARARPDAGRDSPGRDSPGREPAARLASLQTSPAAAAAPSPPKPGEPTQAETAAALVFAALGAGEVDRAAAALDRLDEAQADPATTAVLTGLVRLAQIDFGAARAAFETAARLDPKRTDAAIYLARVIALQGDPDGAASRLRQVLAADHGNVAVLNALINIHLAAGQPAQALAAAQAAHQAAPDVTQVTLDLAALLLAAGQPQQALDLLARPAAADGKPAADPALRPLRAQAELALGHPQAAIAILRSMLDQDPDNAALRRHVADLLANDHDFEGARALLREGLARHADAPVLLAGLIAVAATEGGPAAAIARAEELAQGPAAAAAASLKPDLLLSLGRPADAAAALHAQRAGLARNDPSDAPLQLREAQATLAAGRHDEAVAMLRGLLAAHPERTDAALLVGSLDVAAHRLPQARAELEAVLAREPANPAALNNLAWVRQQQGDLAGARALASRAYLLRPDPQTGDTLGWIVLAQGGTPDALALLRAATQQMPADATIAYHYAAALARSGDKRAAAARLKALLDNEAARFDERPQAVRLLAELGS